MAVSFNSDAKSLIRRKWCKPLLKFLSKRLNKKLLYLGLPSVAMEDIENWIEFIDEVIAFQCREYGQPSDTSQSRNEILKLEEKLNKYERQGLLNSFTVYDGYIEEVVLRGVDNVSKEFSQMNTIRVYNLDFCNSITSPIEFIDRNGNIKKAFKFQAVQKLLRLQSELDKDQQEFVLFLTIHVSFKGQELQKVVNNPDHKELIEKYNMKKGVDKKARILRLFVVDVLQNYFQKSNFAPHFFPTVLYKGLKGTQLIHFAMLGIKKKPTTGQTLWLQNIGELCNQRLITTNKTGFEAICDDTLIESDIKNLNLVELFSNSKTYEKIWQN
ncbi:MAG: hypothetical protein OXH57_02040 [Ekhidna sp.]|nr:hypothetical protein [Ekhidna sp.]